MNRKAQKCNCCSRRRKSADDIPTETIYLYCKPCCRTGTMHKTKCCESCSIFDAVPMCSRPSSEVDLPAVNIELLPGYNEPSNKIDRMLRGLFNCETDQNNDEEIGDINNRFEEDATASVRPMVSNTYPVLNNNLQRTSWVRGVMMGQTSEEHKQFAEATESSELKESAESLKSGGAKYLVENPSFDIFKKSESLNKFENISKSAEDLTRSRTFADTEISEFRPCKIPAEWKKPIEKDESVIWRTSQERNVSGAVSKIGVARLRKTKETKTAAKPSVFQKSGDSENAKNPMTTRVRKADERVELTVGKISDLTLRNSVNSRKSGEGNSQEVVNTNILSSSSLEEGIKTSKMVGRKNSKEPKTCEGLIMLEEKKNEDNPNCVDLRNFPYSTSSQCKAYKMKDRVEKIPNFGNLDNSDLGEARSLQEIRKSEELKISEEWCQSENSTVPIPFKKSEENIDEEVKMLKDMQKIAELISFLSKNSEVKKGSKEHSNSGSSKNLSSINSRKSANITMKKHDRLKVKTEVKKCDQIFRGQNKPKEISKSENLCNCRCSNVCKNGKVIEIATAGKSSYSNLENSLYLLSSKKAESSTETRQLETPICDEQPNDCYAFTENEKFDEELFREVGKMKRIKRVPSTYSEHKVNEEVQTGEKSEVKMVGESEIENFVLLTVSEGNETTQILKDIEQVKEVRKYDDLKRSDETKNWENQENNIRELPKSENFDNFVRLISSEVRANLVDVCGMEHHYKNVSHAHLEAKSSTSEMESKNETAPDIHKSNLLSVPSSEIRRTFKHTSHPEEVSNLSCLTTYESSESKTHIEIYKKEEVPTTDLCSSEPKRISVMDQTKQSSKLTDLEMLYSTSTLLAEEAKRTSTDIRLLEELRKRLSMQIAEDLKENMKVKQTSTGLSHSSYIAESAPSTDVETKRTWTDMSYSAELRKFKTLETPDGIRKSKIPVSAKMYNLRRSAHSSSANSNRASKDLSKPDEPKIPKQLESSVDLRKNERHSYISTEEQSSDTCHCTLSTKVEAKRASVDISPLEEVKKSEGQGQSEISISTKTPSSDIILDLSQREIHMPIRIQSCEIPSSVLSTNVESKRTCTELNQLEELSKLKGMVDDMYRCTLDLKAPEDLKTTMDDWQAYELLPPSNPSIAEAKRISTNGWQSENLENFQGFITSEKLSESKIGNPIVVQLSDIAQTALSSNEEGKQFWADMSQQAELKESEGLEILDYLKGSEKLVAEIRDSRFIKDNAHSLCAETKRTSTDLNQSAELSKSEVMLEHLKTYEIPMSVEIQACSLQQSTHSSIVDTKTGLANSESKRINKIRQSKDRGTPILWSSVDSGSSCEPISGQEVTNLWKDSPSSSWQIYRSVDISQSEEQIRTLEDFNICQWNQNSNNEFGNNVSGLEQMQTTHLGEILHTGRSAVIKNSAEINQLGEFGKAEEFKISESMGNVHRSKASKMGVDSSRRPLSSSEDKKTSAGQNKVDKSSIQILQPKKLWNHVHSTRLTEPTYSGEEEKFAIWGNPEAWRRVRDSELYGKVKNSADDTEKRIKKLAKPSTSRKKVKSEKPNFKDWSNQGWNSENKVDEKRNETEDMRVYRELSSNISRFSTSEQTRTSQEREIPIVTRKPGWNKLESWKNCEVLKKTNNVKYKKNNMNLMKLNKNISPTRSWTPHIWKMSGELNKNVSEPFQDLREESKIPSDESKVSTEMAQSCECRKIETWTKSREKQDRSVICSKKAKKSTKLRGPVEIRKSVKYKKYSNWRVSSEAKHEIEKIEKIKLSKKIWNYVYLVPSEDKLQKEGRKRENISKSRNMPKYFHPTKSTDSKISSCDTRQLQNWRKHRNWENSEKKISEASNKSAELAKIGKCSNCFPSTTSDDTNISTCISEWRKCAGLKLGSVMQKAQGGRDKEVKQFCGCTTSSEELDYSAAERKSAGMEEFSSLTDTIGFSVSDDIKNIDSGSDKEVLKAHKDLKAGELWYYFRAPSSEDARNSIVTQFGETQNSLVDNKSGLAISDSLVRWRKPRKLKYWAIPRHLSIPGNLATPESFGLGKFEKFRKSNDSKDLKAPIILKDFSQQENREVSANVDGVSEEAICERNSEDVCEEKSPISPNAADVSNAQMQQGNYWKNKEICDQQPESVLIKTKDSQDLSLGCKRSDDQLKVESEQSLKQGQCVAAAQEDGKIVLIERMSGGGVIHDDTEEEEEEEVQEQIYDKNLYTKKIKKLRNFIPSPGPSTGCNSSERKNITEQENSKCRNFDERSRGQTSNSRGCRRNEARNRVGENVRMKHTGSSLGTTDDDDDDDDDVDLVEQVQNNVTRRITSSGDIVEVCETVRYAKVFKNSCENLNARMEYPNFNPCEVECVPCEMECSCCCCRHNDYCSDLNPSCCECDEYKSDCDSCCHILSEAPSLGYLNKHDEYIVPDKHGMNKLKSYESEVEEEEEAFGMEDPAEPSYQTSGASGGKVGTIQMSTETNHLNSRESFKRVGNAEIDRSLIEGGKLDNVVKNEAEDPQINRSFDDDKNSEEHDHQERLASSQEVSKKQTSSIENSGSIEGPDFYNRYSKLRTPSTQFQQRQMRRHCGAVSGRTCFCIGCTEEAECRIVKFGPIIGSRKTDSIPDEMGIMKPIKRISSINRFESKHNYPGNRNRSGELDSRNNGPTRKMNTIPEIKNNHPKNHRIIHRERRTYRRIDDNNNSRVFPNKKKSDPVDQIPSFEPDVEPHTNTSHYSPLSDRNAKDHRRRFSAGGKVRDHSTEDLDYFGNNEHDLSSEESIHFQSNREPNPVVNILVDTKGRGQVFGSNVRNVYYSPTNHHATSSSIISVSTSRRKDLNSIDERMYYNRDRQVRRSGSYESFRQHSNGSYEDSENLQMRNRRLGGGADRTDFEEDECYDCDSRDLCCRKCFEPSCGCDMVSTPKNKIKTRNYNQRTYNDQETNGPKVDHYKEGNVTVGGAKRKNISDRRDNYENGSVIFGHHNRVERSNQDRKKFILYDTEGLPDEFFLSQTDCSMSQNNENCFYADDKIREHSNMRIYSDPRLESWSRERTNFDERKYITDEMFRGRNNDILIRRKRNDSTSSTINNGFRSERRYPDDRIKAGGPRETNLYFVDGPTHGHRGQNDRSDREDFYIENSIESRSRRGPAYQNITNDSYFNIAENSTNHRQKVRYQSENAMPRNVHRTRDRAVFNESRKEHESHCDGRIRVNSNDLVYSGRKTFGRTFRNEENFDTRRNNSVGASQCVDGHRTPRTGERIYNCSKEQSRNLNENHGSDLHFEGYYHLELDEDDHAVRRIVVDDDGNIYDHPMQPINNEIKSNVQEPMKRYNRNASIDNNCMFHYKKVLNNGETSVFPVIGEKNCKPRLELANPKKHIFKDKRIPKPNGKQFYNRRESVETGKILRPTEEGYFPSRRLAGGKSENDHPCNYNSKSSSKDPRRELKRQISTAEPYSYSTNLEVRNQRRAYRNGESTRSNLLEKQGRNGVRRRENKFERNTDDVSTFSDYDNARTSRREDPPFGKKTTNASRESSSANVRMRAGNHNHARRTQNYDEENSFNSEESFDEVKSSTSVAPHYTMHDDGSSAQTRLSDASLIDDRYLNSSRGDEQVRQHQKSSREQRNFSDEQKLYNENRFDNENEDAKLNTTTLDTVTESQNSTDQKNRISNHDNNRKLKYQDKKFKCCACQCHKVRKSCTCKSNRSKNSVENVSPILTKWLQKPKETHKETRQVISGDSIPKKNKSEDSRPKEQRTHFNKERHCCCRCPKFGTHNEPSKSYKNCCGYNTDMQRLRENRQYAWNYGGCLHKANYLTQLPLNCFCNCVRRNVSIHLGCTGCNNIQVPLTQGFYHSM